MTCSPLWGRGHKLPDQLRGKRGQPTDPDIDPEVNHKEQESHSKSIDDLVMLMTCTRRAGTRAKSVERKRIVTPAKVKVGRAERPAEHTMKGNQLPRQSGTDSRNLQDAIKMMTFLFYSFLSLQEASASDGPPSQQHHQSMMRP